MVAKAHHRKIFFVVILLLIAHLSYSQKLTFCESVDSSGNPKNASSSFTMNTNGGLLDMLVTLPHGVNSNFVTYDIFKANEDKKEVFENTIKQNLQPEYTWFLKEITFHKAGLYNVYVYDDKDHLLCVGRVTIKIH
jgi:hypothetical protein